MNPLLLLLGLLGFGALGTSSSRSGASSAEGKTPAFGIVDESDPFGADGDDTGGMDMGGDDTGGMDMGGDDTGGMDMGGDDTGGMDMGGDDTGGMDMGGGDTGGMDMGGDDTGGMDMGGDDTGGMDMGGDDTGGMDMGGGSHHGDHSAPTITPPSEGASQAEIVDYVAQVRAQGETHPSGHDSAMMNEHMAAMGLVDRADATHIAVRDGQWGDPNTWHNGEVPSDGARALVPEGVEVDYSMVSDARLFTVRVDGVLDFATDVDSQMVFDTMVVSATGHLLIGTEADPVQPNVDVDLIVANNGPIDTNWDPLLLSRGLIAHGETTIHGAIKDSHEKVVEDPLAGDTSIAFETLPEGWQVGDTIVIAGTRYDGHMWDNDIRGIRHYESEDEVRVISAIDGGRVYFDQPLEHNHDAPREDLATSVANYTRNVSIETENGSDAEVYERGHVMFMHSDDVDVRYMEFTELGRTDKSFDSFNIGDFNPATFDSNVQGRYSLHLHRTGVDDLDQPSILEGNAVFGSPGWGVVHHDSNAEITNTATFNTFGAGFVAETGNETGLWHDNIAIFAEGIGWGTPKDEGEFTDNFDIARGGDGFYFQGRMVESTDNVAASVNTGFAYFHRDHTGTMINFDSEIFAYSDALLGENGVSADDTPILSFSGNEAFAANRGFFVAKANTEQGHDVWSHLDSLTAWNVVTGADLEYTAHYLITDFDLVGRTDSTFSNAQVGINLGNNMSEVVIRDSLIDSFPVGIDLDKFFEARGNPTPDQHDYILIDNEFINVGQEYTNFDPSLDRILTASQLSNQRPDIDLEPITYTSPNDWLRIQGTKTDSLGTVEFPGGIDDFDIAPYEAPDVINHYGYWTTSTGQNYTLIDVYFTDRATGEIFYETHPIMISESAGVGSPDSFYFSDTPFNGVQDIMDQNGTVMAGDRVLFEPIEAVPYAHLTVSETLSSIPEAEVGMSYVAGIDSGIEMTSATDSDVASAVWLDGYEGEPSSMIITDGLFVNTGYANDLDLFASGGEAVLATEGAEFELSSGRTLAVMEAAAKVGFDGTDGDIAILDLQQGSTVAFSAGEDGIGGIEEFDSAAFEGAPNVLSGIDLGGAELAIDLTNLSSNAENAYTLMSADEIIGLFSDVSIRGLDDRNATILVDYENDRVSLQIADGQGIISVDTVQSEDIIDSAAEELWQALTNGNGTVSGENVETTQFEEDALEQYVA